MTRRRYVTMVSEDTPFLLEIVTDLERHRALEQERERLSGGRASMFCEVCLLEGDPLGERGYTYESDSGIVMCLHCWMDLTTTWELIAPGDQTEELQRSETSKHSRKNF